MDNHKVVSQAEWLAARKELLRAEKDFTRLRDGLSQKRRDLPWVKVTKDYRFASEAGESMSATERGVASEKGAAASSQPVGRLPRRLARMAMKILDFSSP